MRANWPYSKATYDQRSIFLGAVMTEEFQRFLKKEYKKEADRMSLTDKGVRDNFINYIENMYALEYPDDVSTFDSVEMIADYLRQEVFLEDCFDSLEDTCINGVPRVMPPQRNRASIKAIQARLKQRGPRK